MFAVLALIAFILALFRVHIGSIDLVILGFVFIAAHLMAGGWWPGGGPPWGRRS
jgi:hypothetical protein